MWLFFFFAAVIATVLILVVCMIELNTLEKETDGFVTELKKHYGIE
jgi:hypothetical protein